MSSSLLSHGRLILLAAALLILVIVGLLMPLPFKGAAANPMADLAHAPLFVAMTIGTLGLLGRLAPTSPRSPPVSKPSDSDAIDATPAVDHSVGWWRAAWVAVLLFAFGIGIEYLQTFVGRHATWHDAFANGWGIIAGVLGFWALEPPTRSLSNRWVRAAFWLTAGLLIALASWTPLVSLWEILTRE